MQATAIVQADNERTTVTEWRFQPGQSTGYHRHAYDYVIVPLTTGKLRLTGPDGETIGDLVAGHSYFRDAGVEHDVTNINDYEFAFVEVEFKDGGAK